MSGVPDQFKAPPFPQVNLMPPEVGATRSRNRQRRGVIVVLVVFFAFLAVAYLGLAALAGQAEDAAAAEEARTTQLQAEIATYSEVDAVKARLSNAESARQYAASLEVFWPLLRASIDGALPEGTGVQELAISHVAFGTSPEAPASPFDVTSIGQITLTLSVPTYVAAADVEDSLNRVPFFTRARVIAAAEGAAIAVEETAPTDDAAAAAASTYTLTVTVAITYDALTLKYSPRWYGTDDQGEGLEEWYRDYYAQLLAGNGTPPGYPPMPEVEVPPFVPGAPPGAPVVSPTPAPSTSPSPEAEAGTS